MNSDIHKHLTARHLDAFSRASRLYDVAILVRRTNSRSLEHIGQPYAVPKRLDCKAKTADSDFVHPRFGEKKVAGLVVNPHLTGPSAFRDGKYDAALEAWAEFSTMLSPLLKTAADLRNFGYVPDGRLYFVDLIPDSPRYSCVKFSSYSSITASRYVHGDFDLYGIVSMETPSENIAAADRDPTTKKIKHARGQFFFEVQHFVNRLVGAPMVQHAADESWLSVHRDEPIDVFFPNGSIECVGNRTELEYYYRTRFQGRKLFTQRDDNNPYYQIAT